LKKFSFTDSKPPVDFFAQNSLQFGRRARRSWRGDIDNSSLVLYSENSSNIFCRLRRQRYVCLIGAARPQAGSPRSSKTAKKPERYRLEPYFNFGGRKFLII